MYKYDNFIIKERVIDLRKAYFKSKSDFAEQIGISLDTLNSRDKGSNPWKIDELLTICNECDVELDYLVGKIDKPTRLKESLKEMLNLSDKAIDILAELKEPIPSRELKEILFKNDSAKEHEKTNEIIYMALISYCFSWFIENGLMEIISEIARDTSLWYADNDNPPIDSGYHIPWEVNDQMILKMTYHQTQFAKLVESYVNSQAE